MGFDWRRSNPIFPREKKLVNLSTEQLVLLVTAAVTAWNWWKNRNNPTPTPAPGPTPTPAPAPAPDALAQVLDLLRQLLSGRNGTPPPADVPAAAHRFEVKLNPTVETR